MAEIQSIPPVNEPIVQPVEFQPPASPSRFGIAGNYAKGLLGKAKISASKGAKYAVEKASEGTEYAGKKAGKIASGVKERLTDIIEKMKQRKEAYTKILEEYKIKAEGKIAELQQIADEKAKKLSELGKDATKEMKDKLKKAALDAQSALVVYKNKANNRIELTSAYIKDKGIQIKNQIIENILKKQQEAKILIDVNKEKMKAAIVELNKKVKIEKENVNEKVKAEARAAAMVINQKMKKYKTNISTKINDIHDTLKKQLEASVESLNEKAKELNSVLQVNLNNKISSAKAKLKIAKVKLGAKSQGYLTTIENRLRELETKAKVAFNEVTEVAKEGKRQIEQFKSLPGDNIGEKVFAIYIKSIFDEQDKVELEYQQMLAREDERTREEARIATNANNLSGDINVMEAYLRMLDNQIGDLQDSIPKGQQEVTQLEQQQGGLYGGGAQLGIEEYIKLRAYAELVGETSQVGGVNERIPLPVPRIGLGLGPTLSLARVGLGAATNLTRVGLGSTGLGSTGSTGSTSQAISQVARLASPTFGATATRSGFNIYEPLIRNFISIMFNNAYLGIKIMSNLAKTAVIAAYAVNPALNQLIPKEQLLQFINAMTNFIKTMGKSLTPEQIKFLSTFNKDFLNIVFKVLNNTNKSMAQQFNKVVIYHHGGKRKQFKVSNPMYILATTRKHMYLI
jgi:hypothetical protein